AVSNRRSRPTETGMEANRAVFVEHQVNSFRILCLIVLVAHHGTGGIYDMEKPVTLKGTVTMFQFGNPHVLLRFDVSDANKKGVINWLGEGPSIINWTKIGWNRNSLKAGDQVTVTLFPAKGGKPEGVIHKIVVANGKEWCCETK